MFPATKSKLKEKSSKLPLKLSTASGSGYNPLSGTFHSLEIAQPLAAPRGGSRHQTTAVATDDGASDSNESCSGESLDEPNKDRRPVNDVEKRDKIRQKNERKHQRQRQRRADELLARCTAFLMSRKLNLLADHLVVMGFPTEQATRALIAAKGHLEEAVAWLLEPREKEAVTAAGPASGSIDDGPRINIDEELERMAKMEVELKCSKQELHKAIVACEGDLKRAAEALKSQKPEASPPVVASPSQGLIRPPPPSSQGSIGRPQSKPLVVVPSQNQQPQQRRQDLVSGTKIVPTPKIASPPPKRPPAVAQPLQLGIKAETVAAATTGSIEAKSSLPATQPTSFPASGGALAMAALKAPCQNLHRQIAPPSPQPLTVPSSLGLFPAAAAPVKWSGGGSSLFACDYNYVDWSLDSAATIWRPSPGTAAAVEGLQWPPPPMAASAAAVEQHGGFPVDIGEGLREWTNAFAGRDLFSQSRKVVMSSP